MRNFKIALSVITCVAFLAGAFWFVGKAYFPQRIIGEMTRCNLLSYDEGADVYIARSNDDSKVDFGDGIFGVGALKKTAGLFSSGFSIELENEMPAEPPPSNVLAATLSPDGKHIATVSVDKTVQIHTYPGFKLVYTSKGPALVGDPLSESVPSAPYVFWTTKGLAINAISEEKLVWEIQKSVKQLVKLIDPKTAEENVVKLTNDDQNLYTLLGLYDQNTLALLQTPRDIIKKPVLILYSVNGGKSEQTTAPIDSIFFVSWPKGPWLIQKTSEGLSRITFDTKNVKTEKIKLPTFGGKELSINQIAEVRVTSRGYISFKMPSIDIQYLLDPSTNTYTEIGKNKVPY